MPIKSRASLTGSSSVWPMVGFVLSLAVCVGCDAAPKAAPPARIEPRLSVVRPQRRTIERTVGQPAFINAYEQTSIYPKIAGYIEQWLVDIGDRIKKDQVLAKLFVPELQAEYEQAKARVAQDEVAIEVARQLVRVAERNLDVAAAEVTKARADVANYQSAVDRWESEVARLTGLVTQRVVDKQVLDESQKQLKSNIAQRDAAKASVLAAEANHLARQVDLDKARVDVQAAEAQAAVSRANQQRYAALVSYTTLSAPYDGVVVDRNANTGDFVQPAAGDKSAPEGSAGQSAARAAPVYVVARTDVVRVFVDVPEYLANYVSAGTPALVQIQALEGAEIPGQVTRTSWALNVQSRTLRAEVDLPNPDARILPGMYGYAMVRIKRPDVIALPMAAIVAAGNQSYCFLLEHGTARKTPIQAGIGDGTWTEVAKVFVNEQWVPLTDSHQVLLGDLAELTNDQPVHVAGQPRQPVTHSAPATAQSPAAEVRAAR
jgi:multidrug efflux pump subunit AcrA (membrane-fusion protein)